MKGRKQFLVESLKFPKSHKAYRVIKIKLKSLFRAYEEKNTVFSPPMVIHYIMWKLNFNFETNFLQFFKSRSGLMMTGPLWNIYLLFRRGTNVKIIGGSVLASEPI